MALPKPDPTRYRGGSTSRLYKEDLQAWQDSQDAEPEVGAVGEEEVVSLASTFDEEDSFAPEPIAPDMGTGSGYKEEGDKTAGPDAPVTYGSFQEALAAAQETYNSSFLEQQQKAVDSAFNALSENDKKNLEKYEARINRSSRDAMAIRKDHPKAYKYITQKRRLDVGVQGFDIDSLMFDHKTMGRKGANVDYYDKDSPYRVGAEAQADLVKDYLKQENIPLYKELEDGTRLYLTTGTSAHFDMDKFGAGEGKWVQAGDIGTYSTYWEPKPNLSFLEGMIANPVFRTALAAATGGASEFYIQSARALTGEDLNSGDWASIVTGGMDRFGVGGVPAAVVETAITGDPTSLIAEVTPTGDTLKEALGKVGIPENLVNDPDFIKGVSKGLETVVEGGSLRDGLESGLAEYITEGGGFGGLPDIDIDLSGLEEALKPIADTFGTVADAVQTATEPFVDVIDEGIDVFGEKVVDPALQAAAGFVESIPTPELPEYLGEFPDLNLPSLDLPSLNLGLNVQMPQLSGTRTTDGLFSDELFKFKTEMGATPTGPLLKPQERRAGQRPEQRQQREEVVDLFSRDPFASPFDRNIV